MIRSNMNVLLARKETREGRKLPYRVVTEETGLSSGVLTRLLSNDFDRVDRGTLDTLCRFFDCAVCDLLEYVPDDPAAAEGEKA